VCLFIQNQREEEVKVPDSVLSALDELQWKLEDELEGLVKKRSGLEEELQAVGKEIAAKHRALELVEATQRQLAEQERGQPHIEAGGQEASTEKVRRSTQAAARVGKLVWPTWVL
jgi:septal ring factor EnvC (AmiA/AmiB activator)